LLSGTANAQTSPTPPVEVKIRAQQFEFTPHTITVQKGQPVRLIITSEDVEHGFAIKELNVNVRIAAKQTKIVEFTPDRTGRFSFYCSVYCGDGHKEMVGDLVVEEAQAASTGVKVTFDDNESGVAIVEANGVRLRVDTSRKQITRIEDDSATKPVPAASTEKTEPAKRAESEPYDYHLVNLPTPKRVVRHSLNLTFTHRFSQPIKPLDQSAPNLLGLDSFAVSSLGVFYGVTDKLYVSAYRSPICQRGLCKTIELGVGYHWLDEKGRSPIALSTYASIEGDDNFTEHYTYNLQAMFARSVTKYVNLFFSPAVHFNANGQRRFDPRATDFFPPASIADAFRQDKHAASFGFGVNGRIRPTVSLLFEYTPRIGFKLGRVRPIFNSNFTRVLDFVSESEAEIGFGIEKDIGRHAFTLTFSNTQTTTTARYNSSNLVLPPKKFIIGFNLYRRFLK
jgi:cytochrome c oxidase subunit 2